MLGRRILSYTLTNENGCEQHCPGGYAKSARVHPYRGMHQNYPPLGKTGFVAIDLTFTPL